MKTNWKKYRRNYHYSHKKKCASCHKLIHNAAIRCHKCHGKYISKIISKKLLEYWDRKGRRQYTKVCQNCGKLLSITSQYIKARKYCFPCGRKANSRKDYFKYKQIFNKLSKTATAWLTGFYEGEGNVGIAHQKLQHLQITQKEKIPLIFIKKILGVGHIRLETQKRKYYIYRYVISRTGIVIALLETMIPFMKSNIRIKKSKSLIREYHA